MNETLHALRTLRNLREVMHRAVGALTVDELTRIPDGFHNNILWNLGHVVVIQQQLHYALAYQPMHVSKDLVRQFRRGSSPEEWDATPEVDELLSLLIELPDRLEEDYAAGRLSKYRGFKTMTGLQLRSVEDAIAFDVFHEGLHFGVIRTYRALLAH